ncbi:MAG: hypothetical protein E3K32_13425 [wastewater metagenome]|nr:hypothetical protein [Candidatus Loosdrechtia aerotolerans]
MKKYISLIFLVISLPYLSVGCTGFSKKIHTIQEAQEKRFVLVDNKIHDQEQALSNLQYANQEIKKQTEELSQEVVNISTLYSELQATLEAINSKIETGDNSSENTLSEIRKRIDELDAKISRLQKTEDDLQNKFATLQSQLSDISSEVKQYDTGYNELGYSNQWLRDALSKKDQQKRSKDKKEDIIK